VTTVFVLPSLGLVNPTPLTPVLGHVTVSRGANAQNIASPKWLPELRARSVKHSCLCSIVIWTPSATNMDALPTSCFPVPCSRSIGHKFSHTTFVPFPEFTQRSPSTFTLLIPYPDRFSALHCRSHSFVLRAYLRRRAAIAITSLTTPSPLLRSCS
jgi:hypothetical protein